MLMFTIMTLLCEKHISYNSTLVHCFIDSNNFFQHNEHWFNFFCVLCNNLNDINYNYQGDFKYTSLLKFKGRMRKREYSERSQTKHDKLIKFCPFCFLRLSFLLIFLYPFPVLSLEHHILSVFISQGLIRTPCYLIFQFYCCFFCNFKTNFFSKKNNVSKM